MSFNTFTCTRSDKCFYSFTTTTSSGQSTRQAIISQKGSAWSTLTLASSACHAHARNANQQYTNMANSTAYQRPTVEDAADTPHLDTATNGNGGGNGNGGNNNATVSADDPDPQPQPEPIALIFADVNGFELSFRLKHVTKLGKAMKAFAGRTERDLGTLRFLFEGERLLPESTTESVGFIRLRFPCAVEYGC